MAWLTTRDAPSIEWTWTEDQADEATPTDEAECVRVIDDVLRKQLGWGIQGSSVLDLGCGRGACLRIAAELGADRLCAVDVSVGAVQAATHALRYYNDKLSTFIADARSVPLSDGVVDLVWSHGVIEHFEANTVADYLASAVRLAGKAVAFSVPNPTEPGVYAEARRYLLDQEKWRWGFEEPLSIDAYADQLRALGCEVIHARDACRSWKFASIYGNMLPRDRAAHWRSRHKRGLGSGIQNVLVATVPG